MRVSASPAIGHRPRSGRCRYRRDPVALGRGSVQGGGATGLPRSGGIDAMTGGALRRCLCVRAILHTLLAALPPATSASRTNTRTPGSTAGCSTGGTPASLRRLPRRAAQPRLCCRPISSVPLPRSARSLFPSRRRAAGDRVGEIGIVPIRPYRRQGLADSPNLERLLTGLGTTALAVALARTGRSLWRRRTRPPGRAPCVGELLLCPDGQRTPGASYQRRGEPARGASALWAELSSRRLRDVRKSHEQEFHSNEGLMLVWREHRRAATDYRDSDSPVFGAPAHKGGEEGNGGFGVSALPIDPWARGRFAGHRVVRVMRQMR